MNEAELKFCEEYESQSRIYDLLLTLRGDLTQKGRDALRKIEQYLLDNLDRYLTIMEH